MEVVQQALSKLEKADIHGIADQLSRMFAFVELAFERATTIVETATTVKDMTKIVSLALRTERMAQAIIALERHQRARKAS